MVKDPTDNSPELDLSETHPVPLVIEPVPVVEPELTFVPTLTPEQIAAAVTAMRDRTFIERNASLGKMVNCPVHGFRHRLHEYRLNGCEQKFTNHVGGKNGYTLWRDDPEKGTVVPDLRTAIPHGRPGTRKQQQGAKMFAGKRHKRHFSRLAHLLVERTRLLFELRGFSLEAETEEQGEEFKENLHAAKVDAAHEIAEEEGINFSEFKRRGLL